MITEYAALRLGRRYCNSMAWLQNKLAGYRTLVIQRSMHLCRTAQTSHAMRRCKVFVLLNVHCDGSHA